KAAIRKVAKGMEEKAYGRLAVAELVDRRKHRLLGVRLLTSWPPLQTHRTEALSAELVDVLAGRRDPDLRTGTLVSLMRERSSLGRALPREVRTGLPMSDVRRRAKEVAKGRWAPEAVRKAVEELNSAVMVAVMAGGAAGSS
ncbi:MAG TPA: GPP34 family phosphoprotein, partial [Ornithinimicrobium sp.]|nr:GPP34 family phosphoprotein [Ornithinimicrobium sp.]